MLYNCLNLEIKISSTEKFSVREIKKHFRLFLQIASLYKKQNRPMFKNEFLVSKFLL